MENQFGTGLPANAGGVSHPLLRRIAVLAKRCEMKSNIGKTLRNPEWLRVPVKKREQALVRHEALVSYVAGEKTVKRAEAAALTTGVSLRTFYNMLADWDQEDGPNIWALVPHWKNKYAGQPRLSANAEKILRQLIDDVIAENVRGTHLITKEVVNRWPEDGEIIPTLPTVRQHVDSRGGFDIVEKGTISLNAGDHAQETSDEAITFGEVLVIDHTAVNLFLDDLKAPRRATLSLAIDLHTASIAGLCVSDAPPNPALVLATLEDAAERTASGNGNPIRPRLLFAGTNVGGWHELVEKLNERKLTAKVRWGTKLHHGGPIRRMIGTRLADLELHARKTHARSSASDRFDPAKHALLTLYEANLVIEDAVRRLNEERLVGQATAPIFVGA